MEQRVRSYYAAQLDRRTSGCFLRCLGGPEGKTPDGAVTVRVHLSHILSPGILLLSRPGVPVHTAPSRLSACMTRACLSIGQGFTAAASISDLTPARFLQCSIQAVSGTKPWVFTTHF